MKRGCIKMKKNESFNELELRKAIEFREGVRIKRYALTEESVKIDKKADKLLEEVLLPPHKKVYRVVFMESPVEKKIKSMCKETMNQILHGSKVKVEDIVFGSVTRAMQNILNNIFDDESLMKNQRLKKDCVRNIFKTIQKMSEDSQFSDKVNEIVDTKTLCKIAKACGVNPKKEIQGKTVDEWSQSSKKSLSNNNNTSKGKVTLTI
jgi:uncharacterized membrane-anchored protein YjiN (DUF445 family)